MPPAAVRKTATVTESTTAVPEAHLVIRGVIRVEFKGRTLLDTDVDLDITANDLAAMVEAATPQLTVLASQVMAAQAAKPKTPEEDLREKLRALGL